MNTYENETIAAIATGLTPSGIGIVRISGNHALDVARQIFVSKNGTVPDFEKPNRIHYGFIHVSRETLDEVLVMNMKAPHSYTGEDTIEINCHGGPLVLRRVLETVLDHGVRLAEPGEFTKRAFLNGRIDLSQAEAVIDVINAKNDLALKAGISQLKGTVSRAVSEIRDTILQQTAYIEAALDDPEHYELKDYGTELLPACEKNADRIDRLIDSYRFGKIVKEGIDTCILGRPNAGKSSLLNALLGEDRAIVTEIPGTTRDVIRESVSLGNLTLNILDTAGIRDTEDVVEKIGVEKALNSAKDADLILYVVDASAPLQLSDRKIMEFIKKQEKSALILLNKNDLPSGMDPKDLDVSRETISICAKTGDGISELIRKIKTMFEQGETRYNDQIMITSARQVELLEKAKAALKQVINSIKAGLPEDFYSIDLMDAYHSLGLIIGEETEDDLADRIFSEFCMGK